MSTRPDGLTHLDADGRPQMVDVTAKDDSRRTAVAEGRIVMKPETLKRIMEEGIDLAGVRAPHGNEYAAFECNVPFVLRYMIDNDISGAGWLTLPQKTYQVRQASDQKTHCQV